MTALDGRLRLRLGLVARRAPRVAISVAAAGMVLVLSAGFALAGVIRYLAAPVPGGTISLLIIGSDQGPPRSGSPLEDARADAMHLLVVSPDHQHVSILDFPRDSWVPVAGQGTSKINDCLLGGPQGCVDTVQALTGVPINAWFVTDFHGLETGINLLGGLDVDVEQRLNDEYAGTDLYPGRQRLSGGQVLAFARDRHSRASGDLGRSAAQSTVLKSLHRQILGERPSVTRIAELVELLRRTTVTNAGADLELRLAYFAMTIPPENVRSAVLDGTNGEAGGGSVVFLTDGAMATIADVRADGLLGPP